MLSNLGGQKPDSERSKAPHPAGCERAESAETSFDRVKGTASEVAPGISQRHGCVVQLSIDVRSYNSVRRSSPTSPRDTPKKKSGRPVAEVARVSGFIPIAAARSTVAPCVDSESGIFHREFPSLFWSKCARVLHSSRECPSFDRKTSPCRECSF